MPLRANTAGLPPRGEDASRRVPSGGVATRIGGVAEYTGDGPAVLCLPGDSVSLAKAIVELLSDKEDVDPEKLLRKPMTVSIVLPDDSERKIDGIVRKFVQLGQSEDVTFYRAEIVPCAQSNRFSWP